MAGFNRNTIVIGTRGSALALWQAEHMRDMLQARHPDRAFAIKKIQTHGDVDRKAALAEIGTRGIFVKEIENALLAGEVDLGIHSLKDLPSELPSGLTLAAVSTREDPRDALITTSGRPLAEIPAGSTIGTSSPRRAAQLLAIRPDMVTTNVRGNVDTRVRKALSGEMDGVLLALAGLRRLKLEAHVAELFSPDTMVPAPGQGIVAMEARAGDEEVIALASAVGNTDAMVAAVAERAFVRVLGGGCSTPLGVYARPDNGALNIVGVLCSTDGTRILREQLEGDPADPESAGAELARRILAAGGGELLAEIDQS